MTAEMSDIAARAAKLMKSISASKGADIARAEVVSASQDGTAVVDLGQGQRTVVSVGSGVSEGDTVQVLLDGTGGASVLSNETDPPTNRGAETAKEAAAQAVGDAAEAVQTANDVPIVTLSSTNGTVFKRNLGVSTVIVATIFTPGGRIDNAAELHRRFGAGAYLEWGWRDVVTDAMHVIVSGDPRIGNDGFTLTVSPEDIDVQAVITCSLNY